MTDHELLMVMADRLDKLLKLFQSMGPIGYFTKIFSVTDTIKEIPFQNPLVAIDIDNDGLGDIYVRINNMDGDITREIPIVSGDGIGFYSVYPLIEKVYVVAAAGTTATINIYGEEGRRCR